MWSSFLSRVWEECIPDFPQVFQQFLKVVSFSKGSLFVWLKHNLLCQHAQTVSTWSSDLVSTIMYVVFTMSEKLLLPCRKPWPRMYWKFWNVSCSVSLNCLQALRKLVANPPRYHCLQNPVGWPEIYSPAFLFQKEMQVVMKKFLYGRDRTFQFKNHCYTYTSLRTW